MNCNRASFKRGNSNLKPLFCDPANLQKKTLDSHLRRLQNRSLDFDIGKGSAKRNTFLKSYKTRPFRSTGNWR